MEIREKVLECLGQFPEKPPLKPVVLTSEDKGTHTLQLVEYCVEGDERIKAYLLLPKQLSAKNPAILVCHQHGGKFYLGKSQPAGLSQNSMYHYGLDMCLRGYVVLCPDHLGFEDRRPPEYKRVENPYLNAGDYERFLFCDRILHGSTLQAKYLSDLSAGIDFLETLDFVDADRIGTIGHSLGGQEALWLSWFEPRVKAGVSSCGFGLIKTFLRDGIIHNFAMYSFGLLNVGDISDLVCDMAPKPFLMTNGMEDRLFPMDGIREIASMARDKYAALGKPENFSSIVFEGGHSFPPEVKAQAYGFLDKILK